MLNDFLKCGTIISTPNRKLLIGWGKRTWQTHPADSEAPSFFFPDYFLENPQPWFTHSFWKEMDIEELSASLNKAPSTATNAWEWKNQHKSGFEMIFNSLKISFSQGNLIKAVPYVFEETESSLSEAALTRSLRGMLSYSLKHPVHCYGFWENGHGMLGATPEMLFRIQRREQILLDTVACAGTRKLDQNDSTLLQNPKELYEHNLVIKGIGEALNSLGGKVAIQKTHLLRLSKLSHLSTPIKAELHPNTTFVEIVKALHPTPALGAIPTKPGMEWLRNYDRLIPRMRFGAPAGYMNNRGDHGYCLVAIRNVQWKPGWMGLGAGCGIVPESRADQEWNEILLKIESIKEMLSL